MWLFKNDHCLRIEEPTPRKKKKFGLVLNFTGVMATGYECVRWYSSMAARTVAKKRLSRFPEAEIVKEVYRN
jgi:hypothetical protein